MNLDRALAHAAWSQFWQLSLVIIAVGVVTAASCRRRPHLAYALWMVVLFKAITPPIWTSNLGVFGRTHQPPAPEWLAAVVEPNSTENFSSISPLADATSPLAAPQYESALTAQRTRGVLPAWAAAWLIGAASITVWATAMIFRRQRLLTATARGPGDELASLINTLAQQLGLSSPPAVLVTDAGLGPAVCGILRPKLILPACVVDGAPVDQLRPIIVHELIHLRRGDQLAAGLQFLVQALWWFHPLVWWVNRQICRVRESCCDAESVRSLDEPPRRYATALVDVLQARQQLRPVFGFPGVRPAEVTAQRVKEVLTMSDRFLARTPISYWLTALFVAALVLPGGSVATAVDGAQTTAAEPAKEDARPSADKAPNERQPTKPVLLLKYGDGKPDGKKSIAGAGQMIRFTMPKGQTNQLKAIRIHAARYGYPQPPEEDVEITILSDDMTEPLHAELVPYKLFKRQPECRWTIVPFKEAVDVPEAFWVVINFNAEQTKGVYVSYDASTKGKYSRVGFNDEDAKPTQFKGDWMVQAMLAK